MTTDFIGQGWAFPLRTRSNGSVDVVGGTENLEKAMRIVLFTYLGERPMRPNFGSRLRDYLFEATSQENAVAIGDEVARALDSCEPRAHIDAVEVTPVLDGLAPRFDIDISYTVLATNDQHNLVVPFYTIPGEEI